MNALAIDVDYRNEYAFAAGVLFNDWTDAKPARIVEAKISEVQDYESGQFYKRELPCIMQLLEELDSLPDYIVVDGHVYLDDNNKPGLGHHLFKEIDEQTVVIGVAKNAFKDLPATSEIYRGKSSKPLYVTAAGIDQHKAKGLVLRMHGEYRLPTLLREVDRICRGN